MSSIPSNIHEIAKHLDMSVATVSRALRPETQHMVKESTRQRVREEVAKFNYIPNSAAGILRSKKRFLIALALPEVEGILYSDYYATIMNELVWLTRNKDIGFHFVILKSNTKSFRDEFRSETAFSNAVFYMGLTLKEDELKIIEEDPRPIILQKNSIPVDKSLKEIKKVVVGLDDTTGVKILTNYFIEQGHKDITLISTEGPKTRDTHDREVGYAQAMEAASLEGHINILRSKFSLEDGLLTWNKIHSLNKLPTATIFINDEMAMSYVNIARDKGTLDMTKMAIAGFDDSRWVQYFQPKLTTIKQPLKKMAKKIFTTLTSQNLGQQHSKPIKHPIFKPELVVRESTTLFDLNTLKK